MPRLDGTYEIASDLQHMTVNGVLQTPSGTSHTSQWTFSSSCSSGCVAHATEISGGDNSTGGSPKDDPDTSVWSWNGTSWVEETDHYHEVSLCNR